MFAQKDNCAFLLFGPETVLFKLTDQAEVCWLQNSSILVHSQSCILTLLLKSLLIFSKYNTYLWPVSERPRKIKSHNSTGNHLFVTSQELYSGCV